MYADGADYIKQLQEVIVMGNVIDVKIVFGLENAPCALEIRKKVFMEEQGFVDEFDDIDKNAYHAVLYVDGKAAAAGRMFEDKDNRGEYFIGRMAVLKEYRGRGYGSMVLAALEEKARELGASRIKLNAQKRAAGFYRASGFVETPFEHDEEGVPHVLMEKQ